MTIKQGLKLKNRLVGEITDVQIKMLKYNSVSESNERPYSTTVLLEQQYSLVNQLVALKTEIHKANSEVYDKIFLLSELKSIVKHLKGMDCTDGVSEDDYYGRRYNKLSAGYYSQRMEVMFTNGSFVKCVYYSDKSWTIREKYDSKAVKLDSKEAWVEYLSK
jgi:hypothetical protein